MQTFTITVGRDWWNRIAGRNPLVRGSDRVQAWVFAFAALIVVGATPVAGAIGTSVHHSRAQFYAEEAAHRHPVIATALEDSGVEVGPGPADVSFYVRASWPDEATVGDRADIWVDDDTGEPVDAPSSPSRAVNDAVGVAFSVWFALMATTAGSAHLIWLRLTYRNYVQWDRELEALNYQF
jgi:hypothetical protein